MAGTPALAFVEAARCLAELGHPHRLQTFQLLVKAGEAGLTVGDIERVLKIPRSTLAHHLGALLSAGLVSQTREGRVQRCRIEPDKARGLLQALGDCCEGLPDLPPEFFKL